MSNREEAQAARAREKTQAMRIRDGLQEIRPHFGWTFGIVSFTLLGFSLLHFYSKLIRDGGLVRLNSHEGWRTVIVCCVLFGAGLVFAMAWWTTRKVRPPKRAWRIAASLLSLALPLYVYFAHKADENLRLGDHGVRCSRPLHLRLARPLAVGRRFG
jgi:NADH:ubiquinone oxidoreductase subunit 5 (subunit L)/multisubunit Na+/H+ antiporter MnhA subunit